MKNARPVVYFGGTFDPLHNGHIAMAEGVCRELRVTDIRLLPCHIPPHKGVPSASAIQRLEMLQQYCQTHSFFSVDGRELLNNSPSYTVTTLSQIRQELSEPSTPLWFIIGGDSLQSLHKWYQWQELLKLCHLVVLPRSDQGPVDTQVKAFLSSKKSALFEQSAGTIYPLDLPVYDISSTEIRARLSQQLDCSDVLDESIYQFIRAHELYQQ